MLIRNCEKKVPLIYPGDFNVRVTVCAPKSKYTTSACYYAAWIETIRDSLGGSMVHSTETKSFTIRRIDKNSNYLFSSQGTHLAEELKKAFQTPISFRIETVEACPKAWVFLLEKDI